RAAASAASCKAWRRRRDHARYRTPSATRSFRTPAAKAARAVGWSGRSPRYRKNPGRLSPCTASPRVCVRDDRTAKQPTSQTTKSGNADKSSSRAARECAARAAGTTFREKDAWRSHWASARAGFPRGTREDFVRAPTRWCSARRRRSRSRKVTGREQCRSPGTAHLRNDRGSYRIRTRRIRSSAIPRRDARSRIRNREHGSCLRRPNIQVWKSPGRRNVLWPLCRPTVPFNLRLQNSIKSDLEPIEDFNGDLLALASETIQRCSNSLPEARVLQT